jgi:serine/threonine-protein kinase
VAALIFFPAPLLPNEREVARVVGLSEDEATRELEHQALAPQIVAREPHPTLAPGRVLWQDPPAGVAVPRGTAVQLIVSGGPSKVLVPDVAGYDLEFAQRLIAAAGLKVELVDTVELKGAPSGFVGGSLPAAGDSVIAGRGVTLHLVP